MGRWFVGEPAVTLPGWFFWICLQLHRKKISRLERRVWQRHGAADGPRGWKGLHVPELKAEKNLVCQEKTGVPQKGTKGISCRWWFQIFVFSLLPGKGSNLTTIFQLVWNHQTKYPISCPMLKLLSWILLIWNMNMMCWNPGILKKTPPHIHLNILHMNDAFLFKTSRYLHVFLLQLLLCRFPVDFFRTLSNLWHGLEHVGLAEWIAY